MSPDAAAVTWPAPSLHMEMVIESAGYVNVMQLCSRKEEDKVMHTPHARNSPPWIRPASTYHPSCEAWHSLLKQRRHQ